MTNKKKRDSSKSSKTIKLLSKKKKVLNFKHPQHPIIQNKINKSLNLSIKEGSYASIMNGFGPSYFVPYALALNATSSQIGLLNALVNLLPNLTQLKASRLLEKFKRKTITYWAAMIQNLFFIFIMALGVLFLLDIYVSYIIPILIITLSLFYAIGAMGGPSWFSWMGSLVPENKRGSYFAKRNKIVGFFGLLALILGGILLDYLEKKGTINLHGFDVNLAIGGFLILFGLAFIFRLNSLRLLRKQYEPTIKIHKRDYFSLFDFLKNILKNPFGRFSIFTSVLRIATNIGAPFFAVYMLSQNGLNLEYLWFMLIVVSGVLYHLLFYKFLGKFSDRFGNIKLIKICSFLVAIVPLLWILTIFIKSNITLTLTYIILVPQMIAGFAWAGFTLSSTNYIYDSVSQRKRGFGVAYFNLLNGVGMFMGAGIGSLLALSNYSFLGSNILFIFFISGLARLIVFFTATKQLREVRHVSKFNYNFVIHEFHPTHGVVKEMHRLNHFRSQIMHYI